MDATKEADSLHLMTVVIVLDGELSGQKEVKNLYAHLRFLLYRLAGVAKTLLEP